MGERDPATFFARLATAVLDRRGRTAALLLAVALLGAAGAARLTFDFSAIAFFGSGDEATALLAEHKAFWGADDSVMLVLVEPPSGDLLAPGRLEALAEVGEALEADPRVDRVLSVAGIPP